MDIDPETIQIGFKRSPIDKNEKLAMILIGSPSSPLDDSGYGTASFGSEAQISRETNLRYNPLGLQSPSWCLVFPNKPSKSLIGEKKVDILVLLSRYPHVLQKVLSYLEPDDLVRCRLVSSGWNDTCKQDSLSNNRRLTYLLVKGLNDKENLGLPDTRVPLSKVQRTSRFKTSTPLSSFTSSCNNFCDTPLTENKPLSVRAPTKKDRFSVFLEEGKKLPYGSSQTPCPRCTLPSRVDKSAKVGSCTQFMCRYQFCLVCFSEKHFSGTCPAFEPLSPVKPKWPRSLKSASYKRKLRRLCLD